jgi:hypothetical protein
MAAAARGEIDVILVFQTSRFWRNRREQMVTELSITWSCWRPGVPGGLSLSRRP